MSAQGPVTMLTNEILSHIFKWAYPPANPERSNKYGMDNVLPLAHVSRVWRHAAARTQIKSASFERVTTEPCTLGSSHEVSWVTNMDLLVSLGATECVTDLYIIMKDSCHCKPQVVDVLTRFKDSGRKWANVKSVMFIGLGFVRYGRTVDCSLAEDDDAQKAVSMFIEGFPDITSISYSSEGFKKVVGGLNYNNPTPLFPMYEMLVRHYRKQLACIQGLYPLLPSVISSVASETADLILSAAYLDRYEEHPLFEASVVQRLAIYNIVNGVNWKWFKAKKDNEIVFSSLERARFYFVERAHRKVKLNPTGGFVLRFPVLYLLIVGDSAPHYGDFYALFHQSPITTLAIGEDLKDFPLIDTCVVANIRILDLIGGSYADVPTKLSTGTVTHFYSAMRKVQDAYIIGNPFPLTAIEQLAEVLTMTIQLEENQVPHLRAAIRQLPKLKRLDVAYRRYQREGKRAYGWELTEEEQVADDYPHLPGWFVRDFRETSDLPTISTQLHTLRIEQRSCETIRQTCFFIRSLPNLRKVAVARAHMHNIGDLNTERGRGVITEVYER